VWPPSLPTITSIGNKLEVLKGCIQLHVDTPDTPNWHIKHHQGLEYLNMAMAQDSYLRTNIQPLLQTGKPLDLKDILHRVTIRKPKLVQQLGTKQVQHMAQMILEQC